jgi:hypothetical protein
MQKDHKSINKERMRKKKMAYRWRGNNINFRGEFRKNNGSWISKTPVLGSNGIVVEPGSTFITDAIK